MPLQISVVQSTGSPAPSSVARTLTTIAGLTGSKFYDPAAMDHGFHMAMLTCAALAVAGGVLAWLTISSDVLESDAAPGGDLPTGVLHDFSCAVAGPPLRPAREANDHRTTSPRNAIVYSRVDTDAGVR